MNLINRDHAAEEYVEGMLIFEKDTISPVGIRYKGSIGAFVGCLDGPNMFEPSGAKICTKLSMKIKINWKGRKEKFFGLKKLQFHSMNNDASQMHERTGYWLFRQMGIPAPRAVHAKLTINGIYTGLYSLVEQIDSRFIKENFDDNKGNLYKEIWQAFAVLLPVRTVGVMGDQRSYEFVCGLRAVTSVDGMTADFYPFSGEFLSKVSTRIINEVKGINRVVYDTTSKPPGTIEWE